MHIKKILPAFVLLENDDLIIFLKEHLLTRPGQAINTSGQVVGTHDGLFFYTLGQRRRLGIGGIKHANPSPWYVIEKNLADNTLVVSQDKSLLYKKVVKTEVPHWIRAQFPHIKIFNAN